MSAEFNLEVSIADWRMKFYLLNSITVSEVQELESYLRDSMDDLVRDGLAIEEAFLLATHRLGEACVAEEMEHCSAGPLLDAASLTPAAAKFNRRLAILVLGSLLVAVVGVVLRVGIGLTAYETTDRAGRAMGFNDPLGAEHYLIIARNFDFLEFLQFHHLYDWLLLVMHGLGLWLLLRPTTAGSRLTRWFFAVQPILFPVGAIFFFVPFVFAATFYKPWDREGFVDIPFMAIMCQPVWVLVSLSIVFLFRGPGLGLANVRNAVSKAGRIGAHTFWKALGN